MNLTGTYKEVRKDLRHPWEKPTRFINVLIFIGSMLFGIYSLAEMLGTLDVNGDWEAIQDPAIGVFGILVVVILVLGHQYAKTKATSIRITENQFSEVYEVIKSYSEKLELGYVPEAYVVQGGGILNAFATSFFSRRFISINSDIFEVSYLEHKDMDTLSFIIAHELTHLKRKHATTVMSVVEAPAKMIPVWSGISSRVKEYTCDRHAAWLCPEGVDGLIILAAGKHLYKDVDVDAYVEDSNKHYKGIFCWYVNLMASHPVLPKRIKAVKNLDKRGRVF